MKTTRFPFLIIILIVLVFTSSCQPQAPAEIETTTPPVDLLTAIPEPSTIPPPAPTPTGLTGKVVGDGQDGNVYLFDLEKAETRLLFEGFSMREISPDGSFALLEKRLNRDVTDEPANVDLYLGDIAAGKAVLLSDSYFGGAVFVPDNDLVAFIAPGVGQKAAVEGESMNYQVFTIRRDGAELKQLTTPDVGAVEIFPLKGEGLYWAPGTHKLVKKLETVWIPEADGTARKTEQLTAGLFTFSDYSEVFWTSLDGSVTKKADKFSVFGKLPKGNSISFGPTGTIGLTIQDGKYLTYVHPYELYYEYELDDYFCGKGVCEITIWEEEHPEGLAIPFKLPQEILASIGWERIRGPLLSIPGQLVLVPQEIQFGEDKTRGIIYALAPDGEVLAVITPPVEPAVKGRFTPTICSSMAYPYACPVVSGKLSPDGKNFLVMYESNEGTLYDPKIIRWYTIDLDTFELMDVTALFSIPIGEKLYWTSIP